MKTGGLLLLLAPAALVAPLAGGEVSRLQREGEYWVQALTGAVTVPAAGRLKIATRGAVAVRGEGRGDLYFRLKKRAKAMSEPEAVKVFQTFAVKTKTAGEWTYLTVMTPDINIPSPELEIRIPRSLKQVVVENRGGAIDARELDGELKTETIGGRVTIDRIGADVWARTGGGDVQLGRLLAAARVFSGGGAIRAESVGGETVFETAGGEIVIREAFGPIKVSTVGNILVERAARSVTANSGGGLIDVREAAGPVTAETSGGSIQIGRAENVSCESVAGPIRLRGAWGALRAATGFGAIFAELSNDRLLDSVLSTSAGDVIVTIPSNLAMRVWAQSDSSCSGGRVVSDFPEIRTRKVDSPCLKPTVAEGAINGGGPLLRVSATGGTVYLRRKK
ncbi:MAG TPA: hypothetical protein DEH78_11465 [Solibacterales bacterium]|nr:hypothetical protein [Bryobacterales bacterium]